MVKTYQMHLPAILLLKVRFYAYLDKFDFRIIFWLKRFHKLIYGCSSPLLHVLTTVHYYNLHLIKSTHIHTRVKPKNIYNHTYRKFLPGQNNLHSVQPDPAEYTSNLDTTMHYPWQRTQRFWVLP